MSDIQLDFEACATRHGGLDLSKDEHGDYLSKKTAKAFHWFKVGFCEGQKG